MFDIALHVRFLQKATEVFFEMSQASVAAAVAMQSRLHDDMTSGTGAAPAPQTPMQAWGTQAAGLPFWPMFSAGTAPAASAPVAWPGDQMQSWNAAMNAWQQFLTPAAMSPFAAAVPAWQASAEAMWSVTPWSFYQAPLMAMMLSHGVPYSVAAPTARASTSAMDCADAACTQWRLVFGNQALESNENTRRSSNLTPRQRWSA